MIIDKEEMDRILAKAPPEPKGVEKWIREDCVQGRYIIYDTKQGLAVCTHCGKMFENKYTGRHNTKTVCPHCGAGCVCKAAGLGRKKLTEYFRTLVYTRKGKTVYAHLYEVDAVFDGFGKVNIKRWLSAFYVMNAKEQHYYKHKPGYWGYPEYWEEYKTFRLPSPPKGMAMYFSKYEITLTYRKNIETVVKNSDLKYLAIPGMRRLNAKSSLEYFGLGLKYQSIELLAKAGFLNAIGDRLDGCPIGMLNWRGTNLQKILRLPKRHVRYLREKNPHLLEILVFQKLSEEEKQKLPWSYVQYLAMRTYRPRGETEREIIQYAPVQKVAWYIDGQGRDFGASLIEWQDYMAIATNLGWDIHRNQVRFPDDLKAAHDAAVKLWKSEKDEILNKRIRLAAKEGEFQYEGLCIVPAKSQEDLNKESAVLHHCVKTYGEKIASGRCMIWFVRQEKKKEEPFYTMETDPTGRMVQCRGDHNKEMTDDVKLFAEMFTTHLQRQIAKEGA